MQMFVYILKSQWKKKRTKLDVIHALNILIWVKLSMKRCIIQLWDPLNAILSRKEISEKKSWSCVRVHHACGSQRIMERRQVYLLCGPLHMSQTQLGTTPSSISLIIYYHYYSSIKDLGISSKFLFSNINKSFWLYIFYNIISNHICVYMDKSLGVFRDYMLKTLSQIVQY